jgi:hypothetical protein
MKRVRIHKSRGVMLVFLIPITLSLGGVVWWVGKVMAVGLSAERTQLAVDAALLSIVAVRADALRQVSEKAEKIQPLVGHADYAEVTVPRSRWADLEVRGDELRKSLPGYKGHITSTARVVLEANGYRRDQLHFLIQEGIDLGLEIQGGWVRDESGDKRFFPSLWVRRLWDMHSVADAEIVDGHFLGDIRRRSRVELEWDVDHGNGGFPLTWNDAVEAGDFRPYRFPYYRPVLKQAL